MEKIKNKIIRCISAATLLFVSVIKADAQKTETGLRFLPTYSSFEMKTANGFSLKGQSKSGYEAGALLSHYFSEYVGIQGEVNYSSISQTYKEQDLQREINLKYINIPLLFSFNTGKSAPVNVNIVAGPQIGINIGSNIYTSGVEVANNAQPVLSVKKGDLSLAYGAGFDYELTHSGNIQLGLGFRGVYGLVDVSDNSKTISTDSYYILDKAQIKTYSIYVGFSFLMK